MHAGPQKQKQILLQQLEADKEARKHRFQPKGQALGPVTIEGGTIQPQPIGAQESMERQSGAAAGTSVLLRRRSQLHNASEDAQDPGHGDAEHA